MIAALVSLGSVTLFLALALNPCYVMAQSNSARSLYSTELLQSYKRDVTPGIVANWREVILPSLTSEELKRIGSVQLDFPMTKPDLLNFSANSQTITLPISSIRMLADLLFATVQTHEARKSVVFEYLALLRYQGTTRLARGERLTPLDTLGISPDVRSDRTAVAKQQQLFASAIVFLIGHELGHIYHRHHGGASGDRSIRNEQQADAFGLELMRRLGVVPVGLAPLFWYWSVLVDAPTAKRTHPLSGSRLVALATFLREHAPSFSAGGDGRLQFVIGELDKLGTLMDEPDQQDLWRQRGLDLSPVDLRARTD